MAFPPFDIPECDPPPEAVERTTAGSTRGNTVQQYSAPVAELKIHYEMQFRFNTFYTIRKPTPYWNNDPDTPMTREEVATA